jgi:hypothetical protein
MTSTASGLYVLAAVLFISPSLRAVDFDAFGSRALHATAHGGREWHAQWEKARTVPAYEIDPVDPVFRNEEKELRIANGIASVTAGLTRLVVLTPKSPDGKYSAPLWQNVEMTIYARRGTGTRKLDYQAFYLSARSGEHHNEDVPCEGTSYHSTVRFDGQCGFKKEIWHTGGYTALRPDPAPRPWDTVPEGRWIGMKYVCRNCDNGKHVRLQLYLDPTEQNEWKLVSEVTDTEGWKGEKPGCDRPQDYVITEARPAVYFRADYVNVELKKFSVREIDPLP